MPGASRAPLPLADRVVTIRRRMSHAQQPSPYAPAVPALPKLRPKQRLALEALLAGATDAQAAAKAGVSRETVNRWRRADPNFIAATNAEQAEAWAGARTALRALLSKAVAAVEAALEAPAMPTRLRAASLVFKAHGVMANPVPAPSGARTPEGVADEWRRATEYAQEAERQAAAMDAMVKRAMPW